ncbi:MAG: mucoidy inhibitor MuiA family protein [Alphaproteobacteria bacterium]
MINLNFPVRAALLALICIIFVSSFSAQASEIEVDSQITAATVYNDRATLTRKAKVKLPAGAQTLIFKGLPLNIYTDSLRAQGTSSANVIFGALEHRRESFEDYIVPREKELNAQIEKLEDQNKAHNAEKRALSSAREFLENIGKTAVLRENEQIARLELDPESWAGAAEGLSAKLSENMKAALALDIKMRNNKEEIEKLRNELRGLRTGQKQSYAVSLPLEADKATTLDVELVYQISNASWQPAYDARLDVGSQDLELIQYAQVNQKTGEDWEDITLTLSTARPSRGAGLPDLATHWVSLHEQRTYDKARAQMFGANTAASGHPQAAMMETMAMANSVNEQARAPKRARFQTARIDTQGFIGQYVIPGPVDVKADGTRAKVLVGSFETDNTLEIQVKPQYDTNGYLVAKATLKGESPALPGKVSLFRDGAYIGQSHTEMLRPGDETELAFGIDDNITVTRNMLTDKKSESGMITKSTILERSFTTRIKNLHKKPVSLVVLETIPVPRNERIVVEILENKTTKGYDQDVDDVKGLLRWSTKLPSKEVAEINLGWSVSWPKDSVISGL